MLMASLITPRARGMSAESGLRTLAFFHEPSRSLPVWSINEDVEPCLFRKLHVRGDLVTM